MRVAQPQMVGYLKLVGFCGIQPFAKPAWYDHSSAFSAFHVHISQPWPPLSKAITWASHACLKNVLKLELNVDAFPVKPVQLPMRVEPGYVPS
jgi:hypothetical protein